MRLYYAIWYKAEAAQASSLLGELRRMQAQLAERLGVCGRVLQRSDSGDVWMEVYEDIADPEVFEQTLAELVAVHALTRFLPQGEVRHIERFRECA